MNFFKNKWALIFLGLLVLAGLALAFKNRLGPLLGGYEKSARGYYYRFVEGNKLEKVKGEGYYIVFQYLVFDSKGDTIENKALPDVQLERPYPLEANNEIDDAMQIAAPGSVIDVLVPADSLKKRVTTNIKIMNLEDGTNARFRIFVLKLLNAAEFEAYSNQRKLARLAKEFNQIDNWAAKKGGAWQLDTLNNVKYQIANGNNQPRLAMGDVAEFHVEIYTLSGALIVNSMSEGKKYKLTVGNSPYDLTALDAVMYYMAPGEEGQFLVTSDMGYGPRGYMTLVPPYTPLLVKITDLKKLN